VGDFKQSQAICEESEETKKKDQCYCSFDETRDKVSIVIKKGGVYDDQEPIAKFEQYFDAVETHLGIKSAGVKKFDGATKEELDQFIEGLVKQDLVGYIVLVGMDLPIALKGDIPEIANQTLLDFPTIGNNYSYVGRTRESDSSCKDVAISVIVAPETPEIEKESRKADAYTDEKKRAFVSAVFSNFIDYHLNPEETFETFNNGTLAIAWDASFLTSPEKISEYRTIYFYKPVTLLLNSDHNAIDAEIRKKPLLLIYATHGGIYDLGLGLDGEVFNSNQAVRDIYEENGQVSLFVESHIACNQQWIASGLFEFCCWPQTWLSAGAWAFFDVTGEPYHYNFERLLYTEKVLGKALRKTSAHYEMVYGDILATMP
jgi:hypothetical protein